ncbi:DUF6482 family protein [Paraglaciecola sp.]|jgi:hypothetical protein|nr:DUF6482 family protein [Paraglaciecola sp.]MDB4281398.1 DUF6482 family protein [Paraglaciecola sp.]MDB4327189.1 DUF6482 family protein [bacterium]|tara:strand:- start:826 stop:1137 length:312 start_codon:yes stop_codon:yes gene_type:complete
MQQTKFWIKDIKSQSISVDMLTVCSYEMNVYLVKLTVGGNTGLVYEGESPKRFHSSQFIRDAFEGCNVLAAQMLHESPYDEMIGNPESVQRACTLPFSMGQPY